MKKVKKYENGLLILSDKIVISSNLFNEDRAIELSSISGGAIDNKQEFLDMLNNSKITYICMIVFETAFIYLFIVYLASNFVDTLSQKNNPNYKILLIYHLNNIQFLKYLY